MEMSESMGGCMSSLSQHRTATDEVMMRVWITVRYWIQMTIAIASLGLLI